MQISTIGIDLPKNVFKSVGVVIVIGSVSRRRRRPVNDPRATRLTNTTYKMTTGITLA